MGEPTRGGGEVGGGGELRFPSTEETEGEGEGTREEATECQSDRASMRAIAAAMASSGSVGGGAAGSGKKEARGVTGSSPRVPGASEEGPGGTSPLSSPFPAPASDAGVLPEGFPVLGGGGAWIRRESVDCHVVGRLLLSDRALTVPLARLCGFAALRLCGFAGVEEAR